MELELSQVLDALSDMIWTARPDGSAMRFNRRWCEYTGLPADEAGGTVWQSVVHPDDAPRMLECWNAALGSGQPGEVHARLRRCDATYRWFLFRANPMRDASGAIIRWLGSSTDIEGTKRAQEAAAAREHSLHVLINTIPILIQVVGMDGASLYANKACLDYYGVTLAQVQTPEFRARVFHPEDIARLREERRQALLRPVPFENEQRARGKDGTYRWFLIRYSPLLDEQGNIDRWFAAAFDIEDRKRAEAQVEQAYLRLAEAQRVSKTGSFVSDLHADTHDWSEEAFRIFELDPTTRISLQKVRELVQPEDLPVYDAGVERSMHGAEFDLIFRIRTPRGGTKYLHGLARVLQHVGGRPLFIGAIQDVTDSKLAEQDLITARSELAHVSRAMTLGALAASIAHEVNQPLAGIITNATTCLRMLGADPPNVDGARTTTQRTLRDGNRAAEVIKRLRSLYSNKEVSYEAVDLNDATREVLVLSMSELQRGRVTLRTELDEHLPVVKGDRVQLQQVLLNLILNAADAMREVQDRPRDLLIATTLESPSHVRLSVRDCGIGIDPQGLEKVFDAFYTTKPTGMGMGLSISRSIIQSHHGRLWATGNEGFGATFSFSIPCEPGG